MMYPTVEVRWFFQGVIPHPINNWLLGALGPAETQPSRIDYYLLQPGRDDLSVKLREGRIEIKQRWRRLGSVQFHERVSGMVAGWRKWGFDVAADDKNLADILQPQSAWLAIQKTRRLRTLSLSAGDVVRIIPPGEIVDDGCEIEVTSIVVSGKEWWTLGVEVFGRESSLELTLQAVMSYTLSASNPPMLALPFSWSYPAWLQQINA